MREKTAVAITILSVAGALAISGCGGANALDPVAQAATTSSSAPGLRMNFTVQVGSPALPMAFTGSGSGSFDSADHAGSVTVDMNLGNDPRVVQVLGGSTLHLEELIKGLTVYMKLPSALAGRLPGLQKSWIKIDLAKAAATAGIPGLSSLAGNPVSSDPSQLLQYLRAVSGDVSKVGANQINGIPTTHYRARVSLDRVPDALPSGSRAAAAAAIKGLERSMHVNSLPVEVWVDGQHLVRRMRMSFGASVADGQRITMLMTVDIPEYGPQRPPSLPPADQVTDINGLLGSAG